MFQSFLSRRRCRAAGVRRDADLQHCRECQSDSVHPVEWEPFGETHWWILLRCGACGARNEGLVANAAAQRFDRELDEAQDEMVRAADRLGLEIMSEQVESLTVALQRDLIGADDFALSRYQT
jgi:hypothetical protein